jgi:long-chain acyl-CoA synthetase
MLNGPARPRLDEEFMVQEYSTAPAVELPLAASLTDTIFERATSSPDHSVFSRKVDGQWTNVSAKEFATEVSELAAGLVASGVQAGDRVGLMSKTRYEWTLVDYAIWTAGAVTVPIYETSSAEQVQWNLGDSGAVAVIVESAAHAAVLDTVRDQVPDLGSSWQIDDGGLGQLAAAGTGVPESELVARRATVRTDSLATIIYTSGTTGRPKGCELTHGAMLGTGRSASVVLPELFSPPARRCCSCRWRTCSPGSSRSPASRAGSAWAHRGRQGAARRPRHLPAELPAVGPRVFEKIYNGSKQKAHAGGKGSIFDRAEATAIAYSRRWTPVARAWAVAAAQAVRQARLQQAARGDGRQGRLGGLRRRAARRPARPLLPRHRAHQSSRAGG